MGESSPLDICMGSKDGASFSVRTATSIEITNRQDNVLVGRLPSWSRVLVRTMGVGGSSRVWVLEPGPDESEIAFGAFHLRGRFKIADKSNNERRVEKIWKRTPPA